MPGDVKQQGRRRIQEILEALAEGKTRDDIARQFGLKNHASLDQYMRRNHLVFDPNLQTYKKAPTHPDYMESEEPKLPYKVTQILLEFRSITADPREVANRLGFKDHKEMALYMREQGSEWNSEVHNYRMSGSTSVQAQLPVESREDYHSASTHPHIDWSQYITLLQMLQENRGKLVTLLEQTPPRALTIPRYALRGGHVVKAVNMAIGLDELIQDFAKEKRMSQREVVEVALIQFFFRYGFGTRVEQLFVGD